MIYKNKKLNLKNDAPYAIKCSNFKPNIKTNRSKKSPN